MGISAINDHDGGGEWSDVFDWPIIGVHVILTPDNKLLTFGTDQKGMQGGHLIYDVWDFETNTHYTLENKTPTDLFCSVPILVPQTGEILIGGGDARPVGQVNNGVEDVNVFNYTNMSLYASPTGDMAYQRWYPTAIHLANGKILMVGGRDGNGQGVGMPELYTPGIGWKSLTGAYSPDIAADWWYPRTWLNSDGKVVMFGTEGVNKNFTVMVMDPSGNGMLNVVGPLPFQTSNNLPAIKYEKDKVLVLAVDGSAWIMDISGEVPSFEKTADVGIGRMWSNLVVLADGSVMVSGGSQVDNALEGVSKHVAIWNPDTGQWTVGDAAEVPRLYHSSTILLPDATVLSLGGGAPGPLTNTNGEIYYPSYLFDENGQPADRPKITSAPLKIEQRQDFSITVDDAADISRLTLIKAGSVTHALNMSTTKIELNFTVVGGNTLRIDVPDNANDLSPGQWMLFAFNAKGTPSVAATMQVGLGGEAFVDGMGGYVTLNGNAKLVGENVVTLTEDAPNQLGEIMTNGRIDLKQDFQFDFKIFAGTNDGGGDGMTFVMHNAALGADEVGVGGAGLGAAGLDFGLALEFDTWQSSRAYSDIANDHAGWIDTDAAGAPAPVSGALDLGNIEDGGWHAVQVKWDAQAQVLSYSFDGVEGAKLGGNIAQTYFNGSDYVTFGFTASTGAATNLQQVEIVSLQAAFEAKPNWTPPGNRGADPAHNHGPGSKSVMGGDISLSGSASYDDSSGIVTLTPELPGQNGAVMSTKRIDLSEDFQFRFNVFLGDDDGGADGLAFVLHNDPRGPQAIGPTGGGHGAVGLANGLALEFDTWQNFGAFTDIANDHVGWIDTDTGLAPAQGAPSLDVGNIEDGAWHAVRVEWDAEAQSLAYTVDGVRGAVLNGNLIDTVFGGNSIVSFGFTGSTGGADNLHRVEAVNLQAALVDGSAAPPPDPTPDPESGTTIGIMGGVASLSGAAKYDRGSGVVTLTENAPGQVGAVMAGQRIDLRDDFQFTFNVFLGSNDGGADGLAFVMHNDPDGSKAIGSSGGGLGAAGLSNGLALEFDTWQNFGDFNDLANDHAGWIDTDAAGAAAQVSTSLDLGNIEDSAWHVVQVSWDAQTKTLSYTIDNVQGGKLTGNLVDTYFGGSDFVNFGFTGSTGGAHNLQQVDAVSLQATLAPGSGTKPPASDPGAGSTIATMGGDVTLNGAASYDAANNVVTLTPDEKGQVGAAMAEQRLDLRADFQIAFKVYLGDDDGGADGLAFVIHNDVKGADAIGASGGGLGAKGLANGLALEFDTWQNMGVFTDIANDHAGWIDTDAADAASSVSGSLDLGNIEDGAWHEVQVSWDAETESLSFSVDGIAGANLSGHLVDTYFAGSDFVTFGFTGSTGGATNLQQVQSLGIQATLEDGSTISLGSEFLQA